MDPNKKLLYACRNGNTDWLQSALDAGADPGDRDAQGDAAIVIAARNGLGEACQLLLDAGVGSEDRERAAEEAANAGHEELAATLRAWRPVEEASDDIWERERALVKAAERGDTVEVERLLALGVDPNARTHPGFPMGEAVAQESFAMMELLRTHGADLHQKGHRSPLIHAIWTGRVGALERLLEWGVSPDTCDVGGISALELAKRHHRDDMVRLLCAKGATVEDELASRAVRPGAPDLLGSREQSTDALAVSPGGRFGPEESSRERKTGIFDDLDMKSFWVSAEWAREDYVSEAPSEETIAEVERVLGCRLPDSYVALARHQNGGIPARTNHRAAGPTTWAEDHVAITGIFSIGHDKMNSLCGESGSGFWIEEWGYPPIGVYFADTPSAGHDMLCLDYRDSGPVGEPRVVHVDQDANFTITSVAESFEAFIRGLEEDEPEGAGGDGSVRSMGRFASAPFGDIVRDVEAASGDVVDGTEPVFLTSRATGRDFVEMKKTVEDDTMRVRYQIVDPSIDDADVVRMFVVAYLDVFTRHYYQGRVTRLVLVNNESAFTRELDYPDPA